MHEVFGGDEAGAPEHDKNRRRRARGQFFKVAKVVDLSTGKLRSVEVGGKRIALFSLGSEIFAIGDLGSHADQYAWHAATAGSAVGSEVERYNVRLSGEDIEVEV